MVGESHGGPQDLQDTIAPVTLDSFFRRYWEREPLYGPAREGRSFTALFAPEDFEYLVCSAALRYPALRVVKQHEHVDVGQYTADLAWRPESFTGVVDLTRLTALLAEGATIVLQGLHYFWPPLSRYCRALEADFGCGVQVNAYYTPASSTGLPLHHDTHDVFVLQSRGRKTWRVFSPLVELPLESQRYEPRLDPAGRESRELTLEPSEFLYMPRGWLHQARAQDEPSLHLTVGIRAYVWLEDLHAALEECSDDVAFRRSVPMSGEAQEDLLARLQQRLTPTAVQRRRRLRAAAGQQSILPDQIRQEERLGSLGVNSEVCRRDDVVVELLDWEGDHLGVAFEGKTVVFPPQAREALQFVLFGPRRFSPSMLPGSLREAGRIVLVRRLIREGLLRLTVTS